MPKKRKKKVILPKINLYPKEQKRLLCPTCGAFMVLYKSAKRKLPVYVCQHIPDCKTVHRAYADGSSHPGLETKDQHTQRLRQEKAAAKRTEEDLQQVREFYQQKQQRQALRQKSSQRRDLLEKLRQEAFTALSELLDGYTVPDGGAQVLNAEYLPHWSRTRLGKTIYNVAQVWSLNSRQCRTLVEEAARKKESDYIRELFEKFYSHYPDGSEKSGEDKSRHRLKALQYIFEQTSIPVHVTGDVCHVLSKEDRVRVANLLQELKNNGTTVEDIW